MKKQVELDIEKEMAVLESLKSQLKNNRLREMATLAISNANSAIEMRAVYNNLNEEELTELENKFLLLISTSNKVHAGQQLLLSHRILDLAKDWNLTKRYCRIAILLFCFLGMLLLLSGCTPTHGVRHNETVTEHDLLYLDMRAPGCDQALTCALNYFYSHGHKVRVHYLRDLKKITDPEKLDVFTCTPSKSLLLTALNPIQVRGYSSEKISWVALSGNDSMDCNVAIDELKMSLLHRNHYLDNAPNILTRY